MRGSRHTHTVTHRHAYTQSVHDAQTERQSQTWWNGLAKLNKCNHCDHSGCDILKCASLFSLSIYLSLPHLLSFSAWVTLEFHSIAPFYSFLLCILLFIFLLCMFLSISYSLWSLCKTSTWMIQAVTLLLWLWACCGVEMIPELPGSHRRLRYVSQL